MHLWSYLCTKQFTVLLAPLLCFYLSQTFEVMELFSEAVWLPEQLLKHPILLPLLAFLLTQRKLLGKHIPAVKNLMNIWGEIEGLLTAVWGRKADKSINRRKTDEYWNISPRGSRFSLYHMISFFILAFTCARVTETDKCLKHPIKKAQNEKNERK